MIPKPRGRKPTVTAIRNASPFGATYFSRDTLRFFNQKMSDFTVSWSELEGAWVTSAPSYSRNSGQLLGHSRKLWGIDLLPYREE